MKLFEIPEDTYYPPTIVKGKNFVATVHRPILTDEERERRMDIIKKAAVNLVCEGIERETSVFHEQLTGG